MNKSADSKWNVIPEYVNSSSIQGIDLTLSSYSTRQLFICFELASQNKGFQKQHDKFLKNWILMLKMSPSVVSPDSKKKLTARKSTGGSQPYKRPPTPNSPSPEPELITLDSEDEDKEVTLLRISSFMLDHRELFNLFISCSLRFRFSRTTVLEKAWIWLLPTRLPSRPTRTWAIGGNVVARARTMMRSGLPRSVKVLPSTKARRSPSRGSWNRKAPFQASWRRRYQG